MDSGSTLDLLLTPRQRLIRDMQLSAGMTLLPGVDPAAASQEEQCRRQQQEEEESARIAAKETKNVQSVWEAQCVYQLEVCRVVLLDPKLTPRSALMTKPFGENMLASRSCCQKFIFTTV